MQLNTLHYEPSTGWSGEFPAVDGSQTLVLVFGASRFATDAGPIAELRAAFPDAVFTGCSSSGEILGDRINDDSLSVAIAQFANTQLRYVTTPVAGPEDSHRAGATLGQELDADDLRGVLVLSDGLNVNGTDLVQGINLQLQDDVVVTGGLAGDGDRFEKTWVIHEGVPHAGYVAAVGFYGDSVKIGHGSRGGWDNFGPEREVTRSEGNVLFQLDGKPALELYKEYLGDRASGLPATGLLFPLAIRADESDTNSVVRTILAVDEEQQSMTFAGDIPVGWRAQLMKANFDRLIDGAADAAELAKVGDGDDVETLAIAVSCVGRRLVLGERTEEEVEATLEGLPGSTSQVGFYSYGEISPHSDGTCDLHNQTMTLTTIQER